MTNTSNSDFFATRVDQRLREIAHDLTYLHNAVAELSDTVSQRRTALDGIHARVSEQLARAEAAAVRASAAADLLAGMGAKDDSIAGVERRIKRLESELSQKTAQRNGILLMCGLLLAFLLVRHI